MRDGRIGRRHALHKLELSLQRRMLGHELVRNLKDAGRLLRRIDDFLLISETGQGDARLTDSRFSMHDTRLGL